MRGWVMDEFLMKIITSIEFVGRRIARMHVENCKL